LKFEIKEREKSFWRSEDGNRYLNEITSLGAKLPALVNCD